MGDFSPPTNEGQNAMPSIDAVKCFAASRQKVGSNGIQTADVLNTLITLMIGGINRFKNEMLRRIAA
jgi:hypothetical protein